MPESTHMLMLVMSDRAIPRSLRMIEGFGIQTFRLINAKGKSKFVKLHWNPKFGLQSTLWDEGLKLQRLRSPRSLGSHDIGNFLEW
jgi:catalase